MSPTLLEGAIAILLVWIAWRIGVLIAPLITRRLKSRKKPRDGKGNPPVIDV
jgi:hypothetical protein